MDDSATISPVDPAYAEAHDRRILLVDDEAPIRNLFAQCLNQRYSCETAANAQEALDWLNREAFALVISDVQMPGIGGIELLRKIAARYRDTAVIIVSGVDRTQRVIDAIREGALDYLLKPCDLDVLELRVERALERRTLLRNARRYKEDLEHRNIELAQRKTELERLQAQLVHNEKMASLGQLAAGVAHELNNPAGFIFSNMMLLPAYLSGLEQVLSAYAELTLPADAAAHINEIKLDVNYDNILTDLSSIASDCYSGAERIRDVVQNLRLFSRLDEAEFKQVDLHEGIDSTIRLLSKYYTSRFITLKRDYGDLPPVNCYAGQLNQVWMNLLINAAQSIGENMGEVRIKTRCEREIVIASISDTGKGIAPEHLRKIFDPFFTTKPVGDGTGLGLSITHGIVERHCGTIEVESILGQGSTFTIAIPVDAESIRAGRAFQKEMAT